MAVLKTKIGAYDPETRAVPVTFTTGGIVHQRSVNAVLKADGSYDAAATKARVAAVARGVVHKIAVGAIVSAVAIEEPA